MIGPVEMGALLKKIRLSKNLILNPNCQVKCNKDVPLIK